MLFAVLYLYIIGNSDSVHEAEICFAIAGAWAVVSAFYVLISSKRSGRAVIGAPTRA